MRADKQYLPPIAPSDAQVESRYSQEQAAAGRLSATTKAPTASWAEAGRRLCSGQRPQETACFLQRRSMAFRVSPSTPPEWRLPTLTTMRDGPIDRSPEQASFARIKDVAVRFGTRSNLINTALTEG